MKQAHKICVMGTIDLMKAETFDPNLALRCHGGGGGGSCQEGFSKILIDGELLQARSKESFIASQIATKSGVDSEKQMDHLAAAEEQIASQRLKQKLNEVNVAAQSHLSPVQDHVNFTLQKAYFKCAYECFDRSRRQEEITNCVENCSIPLSNAQQKFDNEMAKFQEKLNRSLMVCQDKYEAAKLQKKNGATNDLVSCADQSIQESIQMLPLIAEKLKASFVIGDRAL